MTIEELKIEKEEIERMIKDKQKKEAEDRKIKFSIVVKVNRFPDFCAECPMFYRTEYQCHFERGTEANCKLGYMDKYDTRGWSGRKQFHGCRAAADGKMILEEVER